MTYAKTHINVTSDTMRLVTKTLNIDGDTTEGELEYTKYWDILENVPENEQKYLRYLCYNEPPEKVEEKLNEWAMYYLDSDNHPLKEKQNNE